MFTIYHNPRCRKSRAGLQYLNDKGIKPEVVEYLKDPLTEKDLNELLQKLAMKPADIIRTQEAVFKSDFKGRDLSDSEWVKVLVANPKLIKRPIVVKGNKAVIGDPADNISTLL